MVRAKYVVLIHVDAKDFVQRLEVSNAPGVLAGFQNAVKNQNVQTPPR